MAFRDVTSLQKYRPVIIQRLVAIVFPQVPNASGEPPPEAQAERSGAEAGGGRLQCRVRPRTVRRAATAMWPTPLPARPPALLCCHPGLTRREETGRVPPGPSRRRRPGGAAPQPTPQSQARRASPRRPRGTALTSGRQPAAPSGPPARLQTGADGRAAHAAGTLRRATRLPTGSPLPPMAISIRTPDTPCLRFACKIPVNWLHHSPRRPTPLSRQRGRQPHRLLPPQTGPPWRGRAGGGGGAGRGRHGVGERGVVLGHGVSSGLVFCGLL
jgi:hypothetical protein